MSVLDAATYAEALRDPRAAERFSAVAGVPLVAVRVETAADVVALASTRRLVPAVVAVLAPDPGVLAAAATLGWRDRADLVLTDDPAAGAPFVAADLAAVAAQVAAHPIAAGTLALLLRSSGGLPVPAGLVAESAAYSTLQAGVEFARWRAGRPSRAPDPGTERVRVARDGDLLHLTLARPARRNAVDAAMRDALVEAFGVAAADPTAEVLLDGLGPDFCAGGDLDEFGSRPDPATAHLVRLTRSPALLLHGIRDRVTVRVHGACLGAGAELPAFAGRVVAAADARFGLPELGLGLIPGAGGTVSLPRRIGRHRTAWLALCGATVGAEQAVAWGLVDRID